MEIKMYSKERDYSYSLGAFPTIELIKNKKQYIYKILIHSSFNNEEVLSYIKTNVEKEKISINDALIDKLSKKDNVYVVGIFYKYNQNLDKKKDHVLLINPQNMGNLGTIIRSTLGFGINDIAIVKPGVDYFDPKVIRSSMGSIFSTNISFFDSFEKYIENFGEHKIYKFMLQARKSLRDENFDSELVTLAFGNEATGIDIKYLDDSSLIIRHLDKIDSLNITNAVSIGLYEYYVKKNKEV